MLKCDRGGGETPLKFHVLVVKSPDKFSSLTLGLVPALFMMAAAAALLLPPVLNWHLAPSLVSERVYEKVGV
jgi:hypothetical protein